MVTDKDLGWDKIMDEMRKLDQQEIYVGIQSDAGNTKDGSLSMAQLGAIHEFGTTITQGARAQTLYRKVDCEGNFKYGGRFVKRKRSNFAQTVNTGPRKIIIPARPFLRTGIDNNQHKIENVMRQEIIRILSGNQNAEAALQRIGLHIEGLIKKNFVEGDFKPNAKSTIRKKKSSRPLIDTGHLRQSIRYVVRRKGEEK